MQNTRGQVELIINPKTKRAELISEIERLKTLARLDHETIEHLQTELHTAESKAANAAHKVEVLETDVQNLLGALRVFADSARTVRIRRKSVQDANLATALPYRNTEEL